MKSRPLLPIERLWRAARSLRSFTNNDLEMMAGATHQETINFTGMMLRVGYIVRESVSRTPERGRLPHYRLVKELAPDIFVDGDKE